MIIKHFISYAARVIRGVGSRGAGGGGSHPPKFWGFLTWVEVTQKQLISDLIVLVVVVQCISG